LSVLAFCDTQIAIFRNLPAARRVARDLIALLVAVLAFLTVFVFANVAAFEGLSTQLSAWASALVLCGIWGAVGIVLLLALMVRAGHMSGWRWWRAFRAGSEETLDDLERARAEAERAVRATLEQLAPALSVEIASAVVPMTTGMAGNAAAGLVEVGGDMLESSGEIVEAVADEIPGGGVVNQMWDVVLTPGRLGLSVATTVLKRSSSAGS